MNDGVDYEDRYTKTEMKKVASKIHTPVEKVNELIYDQLVDSPAHQL